VRIALTGGSGFVGRHLVHALAGRHRLRLLVRRPERALAALGAELVHGRLDDLEALDRLVEGAEVVVHAAAAIRAPSPAVFDEVNRVGTVRVLDAAVRAGVRRFVLVSSLAARAPQVSAYARSKATAEAALAARADAFETVVVRPPAVYGPGDRATLEIFRGLARGRLVLPAHRRGRFSLLFVSDLAALLRELVEAPVPPGLVLEPDDGTEGGYDWPGLVATAERVLGHPVRLHLLPQAAAPLLARASEVLARIVGGDALLPRDKIGELYHPDWVCRGIGCDDLPGWRPSVRFEDGLGRTLDWYRAAGWLPRDRREAARTLGEPCP